jgi:hypothetical protein
MWVRDPNREIISGGGGFQTQFPSVGIRDNDEVGISIKEVWWWEVVVAGDLSHWPLELRRSLVLLKDAPNNSKIFFEGGRELCIAFSLNKPYSSDDLSFTASRCTLQHRYMGHSKSTITLLACIFQSWLAEVGKVTLKSNSDEALRNESLIKSTGDEALNDDFP